jgi:hypothetical protein
MDWIDLAQDRDQWRGSCEHGNEPSGSIKFWEILEWLRNWRLLKKASAPWSWLVSLICFPISINIDFLNPLTELDA